MMQVLRRELWAHRRSTIIWSVCIILLMVVSMAKYGTISAGGADVQKLMGGFPATVQAIFGMNGLDLTTVSGYYGIMALYFAVMLMVQAGLMGADILAHDEIDKTTEFLYVRPVSRTRILSGKLIAGLINIVVLNAVTLLGAVLAVGKFVSPHEAIRELLLFNAAYFVLQLLCYFLGLMLAAALGQPKQASKIIAIVVSLMYLLSVIVKVQPALEWLTPLSPLLAFDAQHILTNMYLDPRYLGLYGVIVIICITLMYWRFPRRDLKT